MLPYRWTTKRGLRARRQRHPILLFTRERHAQFQQLNDNVPELGEEHLIILRIPLHMFLLVLVVLQRLIRRQHHQALTPCILKLLRPIPPPHPPLLAQQQPIIIIAHDCWAEAPGPLEPAAVGVAAAEGVGTAEGDDFAVVEAHTAEDSAQVGLLFGAVGEAAVGGAEAEVAVLAAGAPGDGGALHLLDGADAGEGPEVRVGDPGVFFWKRRLAWCVWVVYARGGVYLSLVGESHGRL